MRPWSRSLLPLVAAALGLLSCNACYDVDRPLAYPCDPDAGRDADGGSLDGGARKSSDGRWLDPQCHEGFRCGLEGRCHPTGPDAGAPWRCSDDSWCEDDWRCGPDGVCVDARLEFPPPEDAGAARPPELVPPGDWVAPPALLAANASSGAPLGDGCGHLEQAFTLSWVEGGTLRKAALAFHPDRLPAWWDEACDGGSAPTLGGYDTGRASAPLAETPVQLLDLGAQTVALLDGGAVVRWRWQGQGALRDAAALPAHAGLAPRALRANANATCLAGFDDATLAFWRDPADGGLWEKGGLHALPRPSPLDVYVWADAPGPGPCLAVVAWPDAVMRLEPSCPDGGAGPCLVDLDGAGSGCLPAGTSLAGLRGMAVADPFGVPRVSAALLLQGDAGVQAWTTLLDGAGTSRCAAAVSTRCAGELGDVRAFEEFNDLELLPVASQPIFVGTVQRCRAPDGGWGRAERAYGGASNDLFPRLQDTLSWAQEGVRPLPGAGLGGVEVDGRGRAWFALDQELAAYPAFPDRVPLAVLGSAAAPVVVLGDSIASPQRGAHGGLWTYARDAGWSHVGAPTGLGLLVGAVPSDDLVLRRLSDPVTGLLGSLWVTSTVLGGVEDLRLVARLQDPALARGPFLGTALQVGGTRRLVVAAFDTLTSAPLTSGTRIEPGGTPDLYRAPALEPHLVLSGRSPITALAARSSAPDAGVQWAELLAAADNRLFRVSPGDGVRGWAAAEVPLPGAAPVAVWYEQGVGRVGQADGTVRSLPSRIALAPPLPAAESDDPPGFVLACGRTFATRGGALFTLEVPPGALVGAWTEVPLPGRSGSALRAFDRPDGVLVFDQEATLWRLTWEGCR